MMHKVTVYNPYRSSSRRPARRKRNDVITGAIASEIAGEVSKRVIGALSAHPKRKKTVKRKRRKNPALAVIGVNPKRRKKKMATRKRKRNRSMPRRNAKGRFVKASNPKRRKRRVSSNPRRGRKARATPRRRRRRNSVRVVTRWRTRKSPMAKRRRRRKNPVAANPKRRRRRTTTKRRRRSYNPVAANPRRRRRRTSNPRRRSRRYARRRNAGIGGIVQRIKWKDVLLVGAGVFVGDKVTGLISDKIISMAGTMIPSSMAPWVKLAVGLGAAGLAWKFLPALGLGTAVGATNSLMNQYIFGPAWGYVTPYLGTSGLNEYVQRGYKMDNWVGQSAGSNLQGLGNPLLRSTL